ncbi:MAG: GGDEF domain-containing protein [Candidatus Enteromonas sp.]|nr:GGDEF domain-containing protein [Candidatus Enteromonas sp.]
MSYVLGYFENYFVALFGMLLLTFALIGPNKPKGIKKRYLALANSFCLVLSLATYFERVAAEDSSLYWLRLALSFLGYVLRPGIGMGVALCLAPKRKKWVLWLPFIVNVAIYQTCFYSQIAFGFNESYHFVRGPLGLTAFGIAFIYIVIVFIEAVRRYRYGRRGELYLVTLVLLALIASAIIDLLSKEAIDTMTPTCAIAVLSVYFFLRGQDADRDALTGLYNRQIFYGDIKRYGNSCVGLASIDLNRLKFINDTKGHQAGDDAIMTVAEALTLYRYPGIFLYRFGGDEFVVLFVKGTQDQASNYIKTIQGECEKLGLSLSAGIAFNMGDDDIEQLYRRADIMMYSEKNKFYESTGVERRRYG